MGMPLLAGGQTSYQNVVLAGMGKKGVLRKLDNGYYELILGAFSAFGNGNWLYDLKSAQRYIENDAEFIETITKGRLSGEWGHPVRVPGQSDEEWFARINTVLEPNICKHIRKIRLSMDTVKDDRGRWVAAIIGEVRPSGKQAMSYQAMLENPDEDVNSSIRSFARRNFSDHTKHITRIITWDNVRIPGIEVASKYNTPSMESGAVGRLDLENKKAVGFLLDAAEFNLTNLRNGYETQVSSNDASFESVSKYLTIIESLNQTDSSLPNYLRW